MSKTQSFYQSILQNSTLVVKVSGKICDNQQSIENVIGDIKELLSTITKLKVVLVFGFGRQLDNYMQNVHNIEPKKINGRRITSQDDIEAAKKSAEKYNIKAKYSFLEVSEKGFDKMLTKGLLPIQQINYDGLVNDEDELEKLSSQVAAGKSIVVFPEGESHTSSNTKKIEDNAAKIALRASEIAEENKPVIIPVGIHYSKKHYFRERVALTVERPIEVTGSKDELSEIISGEISRASLSREDWKDRELIWKARSIIQAERRRQNPEIEKIVTYGQGVMGARRVRAAWEWLAKNDSKECAKLEQRTREHMYKLEKLDLKIQISLNFV